MGGKRGASGRLVEHGAVVNANDYLGDTALMRAAEGGHTTVVQFLTERCKADVNASNKNGYTALIWAARSGQEEVVRYLTRRRGVEVDARDKNGYTALMKACKGGNTRVLPYLAAAGADVNGSNDFGYTALMIASGCGGPINMVRFLVEECHVVVNSRNNRGETAVRVASDCGNGEVERYLTPFLLHSSPSYVSAATSTTESDVLETQTMSIPPSEVEPIDFSMSSGMGSDYHRVKWLEADACVKLLRTDSHHSSLEKEVQLWQGLRHPNVMNFYGVCDSVPQLQLLVCEYSSKGTLLDHVKSDSMERSSVWRNLHEAAVGLAYLHRQDIVHGDLRCSNILIGNDGIAKLYNVELSGLLGKSSDVSAGVNALVRWQAPEVFRGEKLSLQSDVYSLGMCILEAVTREIPWKVCASDNAVRDRKLRWTPESTVDENLEPRCPLGDAKALVWRMCCQDPNKRASLASVVGELERLAVEEGLDPDLSCSLNEVGEGKMKEMWMTVQEKMTHCDNVVYHDVFDEIKKVQKRLQDFKYRAVAFDQFGALIRGFCTMITVPREHGLVLRLSASDETPSSIFAFRQQLPAIWNALGETTDLAREREARWERFGWPRAEIVISGVSNTICFLGEVETQVDRSNLLTSLKAEIDQSFKYTPDELDLLTKAFEDLEHETLSNLTPHWFIPWYEVLIDEWGHLGEEGFGSVYRAKWLDSEVVVKSVIWAGSNDPMLSSSLFLSDALIATEDPMNVTRRAEALVMFRREVDLWFGFNHPHVVRLFGACHVGRPFFVSEYAPNGTMVTYLSEHPDELWPKLLEAALGVQYLHTRGVVHGDLKGNSIVIGGDLKAKVADFGNSFVATHDIQPRVSGAFNWVAPECLCDDPERPTFASDVYSLGMCIVEALRVVEAVKSGNNVHVCLP